MPKLLSIAVNDYPNTDRKLRGAINDSRVWTEWFKAWGWQFETLWNEEATGDHILGAIERLMQRAQPGDRMAIHFSGHGSQLADPSGEESDFLDECYCPWDVDENGPIRDDQLYRLFQLRTEGVRLYLVADCCHSGSIYRGTKDGIRYLQLNNTSEFPAGTRREPAVSRTAGLLLAACGEQERAREVSIGGKSYGVLTYAAAKALERLPTGATHRQWLELIRAAVRPSRQTPKLVGNPRLMDEPIFGGP
jgi:hypothetical protein